MTNRGRRRRLPPRARAYHIGIVIINITLPHRCVLHYCQPAVARGTPVVLAAVAGGRAVASRACGYGRRVISNGIFPRRTVFTSSPGIFVQFKRHRQIGHGRSLIVCCIDVSRRGGKQDPEAKERGVGVE